MFVLPLLSLYHEYMDVWTIQKKEIIEKVKAGETYLPDYDYCGTLDFSLCYQAATEIWNEANFRFDRGVLFTLAKNDMTAFLSADEVRDAIEGFNFHMFYDEYGLGIFDDDHVLVRLHYDDSFNSVPIDIHVFSVLPPFLMLEFNPFMETKVIFDDEAMPRDLAGALMDRERIRKIWDRWSTGKAPDPMFIDKLSILQLHYGFISPENLTGEEYPATFLQIGAE